MSDECYTLSLVTAPSGEPVSLADVKAQLGIDSTSHDPVLRALLAAATRHVETITGRALLTQTWDAKFEEFPDDDDGLWLPKAPLRSVTSVTYTDANGATQTWSSSTYTVDAPAGPHAQRGRIYPNYGLLYPTTQDIPNAITVRFIAGYGTTSASVPEELRHAIALLVGHWFENREATSAAVSLPIPFGVEALVWPFKVW